MRNYITFTSVAALSMMATTAMANGLYGATYDVNFAAQDVIEERLSMSGPVFSLWDRNNPEGEHLWAQGGALINKSKHFNWGRGFKENLGAGYFGYDQTINDFRVGLSVTGGGGSLESLHGSDYFDFRVRWFGTYLYGTWTGERVNVIADIGYLRSQNKAHGDVYGKDHLDALSFATRFETSIMVDEFDIVPYFGIRYTHLESSALRERGSTTGFHAAGIWQIPVGVNISYPMEMGGMKLTPKIDAALIPALGDHRVSTLGRNQGSFESDRFASNFYYRNSIGLDLTAGHHALGLLYKTGMAPHGKIDQAIMANYQFMY